MFCIVVNAEVLFYEWDDVLKKYILESTCHVETTETTCRTLALWTLTTLRSLALWALWHLTHLRSTLWTLTHLWSLTLWTLWHLTTETTHLRSCLTCCACIQTVIHNDYEWNSLACCNKVIHDVSSVALL